ncbi:hypothetical protein RRF57_000588 [Xylaria bambusicola]|uniref:Protein kinase domain-containing protein n=1 Tax=Xylaria bambusicola TaxID=326684 RepID=A0AAN7YZT8_9PEZI
MSRPVIANTLGPRAFFQHLSEIYENKEWKFEKRLGFGAFGFTALLRRKLSSGQPVQRMALKFVVGTSQSRMDVLKDEIDMLKRVNGDSHIVSILASCTDITQPEGNRRFSDNNLQTEASGVFEGFVGLVGPAVALEYLEYGDIMGLMNRIRQTERNVPNRVLWSLFYCCMYFKQAELSHVLYFNQFPITHRRRTRLTNTDAPNAVIRASVGPAYPPHQPIGSNTDILEELPSSRSPETETQYMLTVGDGPEHEIGVKARLIDLGLSQEYADICNGSPVNIFHAALTICCLVTPNEGISNTTVIYQGLPTKAVNLVGTGDPPFPLPWLDPELRDILARCMDKDAPQSPGLQEALQVAQNAVHSKTAMSFPISDMETESAVNSFVQEFVFNVP